MKNLVILASMPTWAIALLILGIALLIVLLVMFLKRRFKSLNIQNPDADKPVNEKKIIEDNLNRILVPLEEELVEKKDQPDTKKVETNDSSENKNTAESK